MLGRTRLRLPHSRKYSRSPSPSRCRRRSRSRCRCRSRSRSRSSSSKSRQRCLRAAALHLGHLGGARGHRSLGDDPNALHWCSHMRTGAVWKSRAERRVGAAALAAGQRSALPQNPNVRLPRPGSNRFIPPRECIRSHQLVWAEPWCVRPKRPRGTMMITVLDEPTDRPLAGTCSFQLSGQRVSIGVEFCVCNHKQPVKIGRYNISHRGRLSVM